MPLNLIKKSGNAKTIKKEKMPIWVIFLWIALWQILSMIINQQILLPSPLSVLEKLFLLVREFYFWQAVFFSILRISAGFVLAVIMGTVFAFISHKFLAFKHILSPFILISKSVPVASIIILILVWISSKNIAVFISFIMVLPIVYTNILSGIANLNEQLAEMSRVFKIKSGAKLRYITILQIMPFFESACMVGLGLCFKAGIAAEVIGLPDNSIGENLFEAKIFLDMPALFAWTIVIILVSLLFEKAFAKIIVFFCRQLRKVRLK